MRKVLGRAALYAAFVYSYRPARLMLGLVAALLFSWAPAYAAYPYSVPAVTDFTVSDTLTATCSTSNPLTCAAHSVVGSVTNNTGSAIVTISGTFSSATINSEGGD